jgi:hypothetical protein
MKNYLLLTASAVLVLSSCSNNEIVENHDLKTDGPKTMNFLTYVPGATRALVEAEEATDVKVQETGFYLFTDQTVLVQGKEEQLKGFMTFDENNGYVMSGQQLQWPTDLSQDVQFYAVYSASGEDDNFSVTETGDFGKVLRGFDFTSGENDYMVAADTSNYNKNNGNVTLNFQHILAQVEVRVVGTVPGYVYEVGGVTITAQQSSSLVMDEGNSFVDENDTIVYKLDECNISDDGNVNSTPNQLVLLSNYTNDDVYGKLMVVPGTCYLSMKYRIYAQNENGPENWESTGYYAEEGQKKVVDIESQSTKSFDVVQGYKNIITIKLNPETRAMTFNVSVASWDEDPNAADGGTIIEL